MWVLHQTGPGHGLVAGSCEHSNETPFLGGGSQFLIYLSISKLELETVWGGCSENRGPWP
jgi:hypothetical protein